jgi:hypothetical protein
MAFVQLAQSAFGLVASIVTAWSEFCVHRRARSAEPLTWRSAGRSTVTPAIVTLRLGSH